MMRKLLLHHWNSTSLNIQKNNQAISREELLKEVWKIAYDIDTRATDDTVKRLRRKIADSNVEIKTVWGYGFKMALKK